SRTCPRVDRIRAGAKNRARACTGVPGGIRGMVHRGDYSVSLTPANVARRSTRLRPSRTRQLTDWNTLVVRTERLVERGADIVIARSDRRDALQANQPHKANALGPANLDLILSRLRSAESYSSMAAALTPQMGAREFENAIGELLSRGLIHLRV